MKLLPRVGLALLLACCALGFAASASGSGGAGAKLVPGVIHFEPAGPPLVRQPHSFVDLYNYSAPAETLPLQPISGVAVASRGSHFLAVDFLQGPGAIFLSGNALTQLGREGPLPFLLFETVPSVQPRITNHGIPAFGIAPTRTETYSLFRLPSMPEPPAWLLLLCGLSAALFIAHRKLAFIA